ncbi:MAG: universal stress protein [Nitrososphaerales archaeon]
MKRIKLATVLSDNLQSVEKVRQASDSTLQRERLRKENLVSSEPLGLSANQRILVPITEGNESKTKELLQYASSLARRYSMKITLVCAIPELDIPEGYMAFAKVEGIRDYHYAYIESVSGSMLSKWKLFLENEGIEYDSLTYFGSMKDAVRESMKMRSAGLVVVRPNGTRKGLINRILHPTFLGSIPFKASTESHTPVLVIS